MWSNKTTVYIIKKIIVIFVIVIFVIVIFVIVIFVINAKPYSYLNVGIIEKIYRQDSDRTEKKALLLNR